MTVQILDSPLSCPKDGKRMVMELGQHDSYGGLEMTHTCWSCGYTEVGRRHPRKVFGASRLAELLAAQRLGEAEHVDA